MDIDRETMTSPPFSSSKGDKHYYNLVSLVDMFRDIAVGYKKILPRLSLQEAEKHTSLSRHISRNQKIF
jgi:hypothetical protein